MRKENRAVKKKEKQAVILLGVLAILSALFFTLRVMEQKKAKEEAKKEEAEKIYVTDIKDVMKIKYQSETSEMEFEKAEEGEWVYTGEPDFPLAQRYPEEMKDTFEKLEVSRELKDGDELAAYGLEEPQYQVTLTDKDGTETVLYFGNAVDDGYYLTVDDTKKVYTVSNVIEVFQYSLDEMAQLDEYPNIGSGNLKKETITQNGETTTYDSANEDDTEAIAAVAGGLGAVQLSLTADYSVTDEELTKYGLDENERIFVEATYTENDKDQVLQLFIGGEDGNGNRYVMINDSRIVYLISDEVCSNILNLEEEK